MNAPIVLLVLMVASVLAQEDLGAARADGVDIPIPLGSVSVKNSSDGTPQVGVHQGLNIGGHGFSSGLNVGRRAAGKAVNVPLPLGNAEVSKGKDGKPHVQINQGLHVAGHGASSSLGVGRH